jgi:tRNA nucleotidyltransferase (CCA-adding enzyme)
MTALLEGLPADDRKLVLACGERAAARDMRAFLVGGAVRDLLLGRSSPDLDILIVGDAIVAAQDLARLHGGEVLRHHAFRTATVLLNAGARRIDFATARSETYSKPGVLPVVSPGTLEEDLARRDFTINTIALSLHADSLGELTDPFDGQADLAEGQIRFLHEQSFSDDPTRLLRALRFALRLDAEIEPRTARAIRDAARGGFLAGVTGDRVRREFAKLLAEQPVAGPRALAEWGLVDDIFAELEVPIESLERLAAVTAPEDDDLAWKVLAVMGHTLAPQSRWDLGRRLRLPGRAQRLLVDTGAPWHQALEDLCSLADTAAPSAVADVLDGFDLNALQVGQATLSDSAQRARIAGYVELHRDVKPLLTGADVRRLGGAEGPAVGEVLRQLRRARLDGFVSDKADETAMVKRLLAKAN